MSPQEYLAAEYSIKWGYLSSCFSLCYLKKSPERTFVYMDFLITTPRNGKHSNIVHTL